MPIVATMGNEGLRSGHLAALAGALLALSSLWLPWYAIDVPGVLRRSLDGIGQDPGLLGQMARGLASALPQTITATGWQALRGADVALCGGALAVLVLVLGAAGAFGTAVRIDGPAAARGSAVLGAAGVLLCAQHMVSRPFSSDLVHIRTGLWAALIGCGLALIGGLLASSPRRTGIPAPAAVRPPAFEPPAGSVPPPGV